MVCPHCGSAATGAGGACASCGRALPHSASTAVTTLTPSPDAPQPAAAASSARTEGPLAVGQQFGSRYRILKVLGAGGMGVVYQAWDGALDLPVALKVIRPEVVADLTVAREVEGRFRRELVLARQVTHRNVVRIHDLGEIDGIKYISMPFIEGKSLATILAESGRLPCASAVQIVRQIAEGLKAAHDAGVIHRDLKPENVMIDAEGHAVIMDFGISRPAEGGTTLGLTAAGSVIGTVQYMAPEQAMGQAVDQRADIYALGLIAYDLIAGCYRFANVATPVSEMMQRVQHAPAPLRAKAPDAPPEIERMIARALEPDPAKRYQQVDELIADLDAFMSGAAPKGLGRLARASKGAIAATALIIVAAVGGASWWLSRARTPATVAPHETVSVLVADFENRTGDPLFEGSVEQALGIGLEGASFLTAYPRRDAMRAVAQISPDAKLTEANARLVSRREGVNVVIAGSVLGEGGGYRVTVKAIDSVSGNELASASSSASDKPKVLEAVGDVAAQIRKALGDTTVESAGQTARETFTAASLEAAREYSLGQDLANANRDEEALTHYQRATALDPGFGRAYSGGATSEVKLGRRSAAEQHYKQAFEHADRMTEREKLRTYGSYFLQIAGDNAQAVTMYSELVAKYPADGAGHNGLAIAYFNTRQFQKALAEGSVLLKIYPRSVLYRYNYALYAMYAGDFAASEREAKRALELNPNTPKAYLAIAMAALARGNSADAAAAYRKVAATGARGVSLASIGLADIALYQGRPEEAIRMLQDGITADVKNANASALAAKYIARADAEMLIGATADALASAQKAMQSSRNVSILMPAAELFLAAHRSVDARKIAMELGTRLSDYDRAGGKVVDAHIALDQGRFSEAIASLRDAAKLADLWIVTLHTGIAYYQAGSYPQALAAFEECDRRSGEMTAVFLDDVPTYRYRVTLLYWLGKARAALGQASAAATLKEFLSHRPPTATDPMTVDARRIVEGH